MLTDPSNSTAFYDSLGRHIRRGLKEIKASWTPSFDYLLQEMYFDRRGSAEENREAEGLRLKERLDRVLGQLGVGPVVTDHKDGPSLTRFILELHQINDLDRLRKGLSKIAFALGLGENSADLVRLPVEPMVSLDIPRSSSSWTVVTWADLVWSLDSGVGEGMTLPICIGTDVLGEPVVLDLVEAPHLFVAGTTGSGKSMCLHGILLSLIHRQQRVRSLY